VSHQGIPFVVDLKEEIQEKWLEISALKAGLASGVVLVVDQSVVELSDLLAPQILKRCVKE
jgi:hypothetical protein